jgi:hypothetical protein
MCKVSSKEIKHNLQNFRALFKPSTSKLEESYKKWLYTSRKYKDYKRAMSKASKQIQVQLSPTLIENK